MEKLAALYKLFQAGSEIDNKVRVQNGTLAVNNIVIFISALVYFLHTFDCSWCNIELTNEQLVGLSSGLLAIWGLFNNVSHAVTNKDVTINPVTNVKEVLAKKELPKVDKDLAQIIRENQDV